MSVTLSTTSNVISLTESTSGVTLTAGNPAITLSLATDSNIDLSGYIPKTIITAKGDLITGTASSEPATLSSQAYNGYFPVVDTSEAKGLKFTNQIDGGQF